MIEMTKSDHSRPETIRIDQVLGPKTTWTQYDSTVPFLQKTEIKNVWIW